jgi:predicted nucleic acid-binding protein
VGEVVLSILDTSILIGTRIEPIEGDLAISAISIAELKFGVLVTDDPQVRALRLARLSAILQNFDPLPVDSYVAASYGRLVAMAQRCGRKASARSLDLMIAATAHAHGARLVTANFADVSHLQDAIEVVEP